jgi:hypothetical protein
MNKELKNFLEVEIKITSERLKDELNPFFNGVPVGAKKAHRLKELHIKFCQQMLAMIDK